MAKTHGMKGTSTYCSWKHMRRRCSDPKNKDFPNYGGRGITVCERWQNSFKNFLADMGVKPDGFTIERKNNLLGYFPENCKWATKADQNRNRDYNTIITIGAESHCMAEWDRRLGASAGTIRHRLKRGWSQIEAATIPVGKTRKKGQS